MAWHMRDVVIICVTYTTHITCVADVRFVFDATLVVHFISLSVHVSTKTP